MCSRMCPACGRGIRENERYQVCSGCKRNYHLGHQCPLDENARMDIVNPSSPITITRRPNPVHIPELVFWNPFHWIILLWWILVRPDLLKAYKEQLDQVEGSNRLEKVGSWLVSTLSCLPLFLCVLIVQPHLDSLIGASGDSFSMWLYGHWVWMGGAVLLLWLLIGLLPPLLDELFLDSELVFLTWLCVMFPVAAGLPFFVLLGLAGFVAASGVPPGVISFLVAFGVAVSVVYDDVASPSAMSAWCFLTSGVMFGLLFLALAALRSIGDAGAFFIGGGVAFGAALGVKNVVEKSIKEGSLSWWTRGVFGGWALSHAALLWEVAKAWGLLP